MHLFTLAKSGNCQHAEQTPICLLNVEISLFAVTGHWFSIQILARWPLCKVVLVFVKIRNAFVHSCTVKWISAVGWLRGRCSTAQLLVFPKNLPMNSAHICIIIFQCCRQGQMQAAQLSPLMPPEWSSKGSSFPTPVYQSLNCRTALTQEQEKTSGVFGICTLTSAQVQHPSEQEER